MGKDRMDTCLLFLDRKGEAEDWPWQALTFTQACLALSPGSLSTQALHWERGRNPEQRVLALGDTGMRNGIAESTLTFSE